MNQKIERKRQITVYLHPEMAPAYLGEEKGCQHVVDEIVKEDANTITVSYSSRGWDYTDQLPRQFCIVSRAEESLENAERRMQKTGIPMPIGTKSSASSKKE